MGTQLQTPRLVDLAWQYLVDAGQRHVLFWDILRKRGNVYRDHLKDGQPPVLVFDHEIIMDGRELTPPSNYKLASIFPPEGCTVDPKQRPVIVIDPRAGHGPGIGGAKRNSEIGIALAACHPVYFILFDTDPVARQTVADVIDSQVTFIEEVMRRHPDSPKPSVAGNCQAGWALAILAADRPGTTGPIVLNGSPLSYWAGLEGKDTMRYLGGMLGGVWVNAWLADLGAGTFDGANLVLNFEMMNPSNTFWRKQYHVWANVDSEEQRYLDFERWWNGYFNLTKEEIHFIVDNLFIDNRLEMGSLVLRDGKALRLKDIQEPIVVFCSSGDQITPPQQALNWIVHTWDSVDEIKHRGQVVVYMIHPFIGHLGIFVSGKVAAKEHKAMINSFDMIEMLPPGLYEMVFENDEKNIDPRSEYLIRFEEREIEDIIALDDHMTEEEEHFPLASAVSQRNDAIYDTFISPWVRAMMTPMGADILRQLHPMRVSRYGLSDLNPLLWPFASAARQVKKQRAPAAADNPFLGWERAVAKSIETSLENYRLASSFWVESAFQMLYGDRSPLNWFYPETSSTPTSTAELLEQRLIKRQKLKAQHQHWLGKMREGGFLEGVVRAVVAITAANEILERETYMRLMEMAQRHSRLKTVEPTDFRRIVREQSQILQANPPMARETLRDLLTSDKDRADLLEICTYVFEHNDLYEETRDMIRRLRQIIPPPKQARRARTAPEPEGGDCVC
jgi:hypothetical protein